jgi:uncharacterized membrane protein
MVISRNANIANQDLSAAKNDCSKMQTSWLEKPKWLMRTFFHFLFRTFWRVVAFYPQGL